MTNQELSCMKLPLHIFLLSFAAAVGQGRLQNGHLRGLGTSDDTESCVDCFRLAVTTTSIRTSISRSGGDSTSTTGRTQSSSSTSSRNSRNDSDESSTSNSSSSSSSDASSSSSSERATTSSSTSTDSSDSSSSDTSSSSSSERATSSSSTSTDSSNSSSERTDRSNRLECRHVTVSNDENKCIVWVTNEHQDTIYCAFVATEGPIYNFEVTEYELNGDSSMDEQYEFSSGDESWDAEVDVDSSGDLNFDTDVPDVTCLDLMNNPEYEMQDREVDELGAAWLFTTDEEYKCTAFGKKLIWFFVRERFLTNS